MNRIMLTLTAASLLGSAWSAMAGDTGTDDGAERSTKRLSSGAELDERIEQLAPDFASLDEAEGGQIGCRILDPLGNPTSVVSVSEFGDQAYWLGYINDGEIDQRVNFIVLPNFEGSPLRAQRQVFETNDACNISTPFGIPFWGLDRTSGPWVLVVRNDRGLQRACPFEVVAQAY